jgi:hypothetical protein
MSDEELAKDPSTPALILAKLAKKKPKLAALVAKNPNITKAALFQLGAKHPKEFLQNPMVPLLVLEDPPFWGGLPSGLLLSLLRTPNAPIEKISEALVSKRKFLSLSTKLELAFASHPKTSVDFLIQLAGSFDAKVQARAARNPKLPQTLAKIAGAKQHLVGRKQYLMTRDPPLLDHDIVTLTNEEIEFAIQQGEWFCRTLAQLANTPAHILQKLLHNESYTVTIHAAENSNTPIEALRELLTSTHFFGAIALNHASDQEMISFVWDNLDLWTQTRQDHDIREALAQNPNTPTDIVLELLDENLGFDSRHLRVLHALAENPTLPPEVLQEIYEHAPAIQDKVIENANCPERLLLSHDDPSAQIKNPKLPEPIAFALMQRIPSLARLFLENKKRAKLSQELLVWLARHEQYEVRCLIAGHPDMPESSLEALSKDKRYLVRAAVAERKILSQRLRDRLTKDKHPLVRKLAQD